MTEPTSHLDTIKALFASIQSDTPDADPARFYTPDVVQYEFPNRLLPGGTRRDLQGILDAAARGRGVMASQTFEILNAVTSGDTVVIEAAWSGTLAVDIGPVAAGTVMRARFAQIYEFRDGRISALRNYDCFEPW